MCDDLSTTVAGSGGHGMGATTGRDGGLQVCCLPLSVSWLTAVCIIIWWWLTGVLFTFISLWDDCSWHYCLMVAYRCVVYLDQSVRLLFALLSNGGLQVCCLPLSVCQLTALCINVWWWLMFQMHDEIICFLTLPAHASLNDLDQFEKFTRLMTVNLKCWNVSKVPSQSSH